MSRSDPNALKASLRRIGDVKAEANEAELRAWLALPLGERLARVLADCGGVPALTRETPEGADPEADAWERVNAKLARTR